MLVAVDARARAPRRTGALAASIVPVPEGVAALVDYSRYVEFGTRNMEAEPYLRDALGDRASDVSNIVANAVKTALYAL
jgi:HK97 gp10 family phage protein